MIRITEIHDDELFDVFKWDPISDKLQPSDPEEIAAKSRVLREAWARLGMPGGDLASELAERARFLEERLNLPKETFISSLFKFYATRYGVLRE